MHTYKSPPKPPRHNSNKTRHAIANTHQSTNLIPVPNNLPAKIILRPHKPHHRLQAPQAPNAPLALRPGNEIQDRHPLGVIPGLAREDEQREGPPTRREVLEDAEGGVYQPRELFGIAWRAVGNAQEIELRGELE